MNSDRLPEKSAPVSFPLNHHELQMQLQIAVHVHQTGVAIPLLAAAAFARRSLSEGTLNDVKVKLKQYLTGGNLPPRFSSVYSSFFFQHEKPKPVKRSDYCKAATCNQIRPDVLCYN